jgi:hypothetical protein
MFVQVRVGNVDAGKFLMMEKSEAKSWNLSGYTSRVIFNEQICVKII